MRAVVGGAALLLACALPAGACPDPAAPPAEPLTPAGTEAPAPDAARSAASTGSADSAGSEATWNAALALIQENYLQARTRDEIVEQGLRALLQDLDPYSFYLDADEWRQRKEDLTAEFGGVGVYLDAEPGAAPRIRYLLLGGAAGAAGARRGDQLLAVDGIPVVGESIERVLDRLRGTPGSQVELTLRREEVDAPLRLAVVRTQIQAPSVRGLRRAGPSGAHFQTDFLLDGESRIGYIRISALKTDTVAQVEAALVELRARQMQSLILDLRESSGGRMQAAIGVADLFLESGRILTERGRDEVTHYDAQAGGFTGFPMLVLINGGTASSSEFLAAALQDNRRALFLGQRTYGKARIQKMLSLGEGRGGLILTTATFERPSGKALDRHDGPKSNESGVAPDAGMELIVDGDEYEAWLDAISLADTPALLEASDLEAMPPDRMLLHATKWLEQRTPAPDGSPSALQSAREEPRPTPAASPFQP